MPTGQTNDALRAASTSLLNATQRRNPGSDNLGKQDFLNLLMAQVTHQDPMNPMDSKGMMDQLTQMGSLEQMININKNIEELGKSQQDLMRSNAYTFLNKDVKVQGGEARVSQGVASPLHYELPRSADQVEVRIKGPEGEPVRDITLGSQGAGAHSVKWEPRGQEGEPIPDGRYQYDVVAKSEQGEDLPVKMYSWGKVSGVRFNEGRPTLTVNGAEVDVRDVMEVSNRSERTYTNSAPYPLREQLRAKPPVFNNGNSSTGNSNNDNNPR